MLNTHGAGLPLAEALYWRAEELYYGYEDVPRRPAEAFKLYRQAAELGFSHAFIRIGQMQERGTGTRRSIGAAIVSYKEALNIGNSVALGFIAILMSRSHHIESADAIWNRFLISFDRIPECHFVTATRGQLLYRYIESQLRLGFEPSHIALLRTHRIEIASYHQLILDHISDAKRIQSDATFQWILLNLGPWPATST